MRTFASIGRVVVALFYLYAAYENIFMADAKLGYAAAKGVPLPALLVPLSGLLLLIGGLSILTGYKPQVGVAALLLFYLPVTVIMHNFWTVQEPMLWAIEFHGFLANVALAGSALMLLAIPQPWRLGLPLSLPQTQAIVEVKG